MKIYYAKNSNGKYLSADGQTRYEKFEYSAKVEHPDRFELNSATAQIEQSNRRN